MIHTTFQGLSEKIDPWVGAGLSNTWCLIKLQKLQIVCPHPQPQGEGSAKQRPSLVGRGIEGEGGLVA
jgi:hypothetical protein